jgi:hypothetical protein
MRRQGDAKTARERRAWSQPLELQQRTEVVSMVAYSERVWTSRVVAQDMPTIIRAYAELRQLSNAELVRARQRAELREQRARDRRARDRRRKRATAIRGSA